MIQRVKTVLVYALVIVIGGSIFSWVAVNVLLKPSPNTESPELVYAKTQAQLAEIARNQESNIFWGHFFQWGAIVMLLLAVVGASTAIIIVWTNFTHRIQFERERLERESNVFPPDSNGNYSAFRVGPGQYFVPAPGNPGVPGPAPQALPAPISRNPRTLKMNGVTQPFSVKWDEEDGPPPARANTTFEANANERTPNTEQDMQKLLAEAYERGEVKTSAIPRITGAKRGQNKAWIKWSNYWDTL